MLHEKNVSQALVRNVCDVTQVLSSTCDVQSPAKLDAYVCVCLYHALQMLHVRRIFRSKPYSPLPDGTVIKGQMVKSHIS